GAKRCDLRHGHRSEQCGFEVGTGNDGECFNHGCAQGQRASAQERRVALSTGGSSRSRSRVDIFTERRGPRWIATSGRDETGRRRTRAANERENRLCFGWRPTETGTDQTRNQRRRCDRSRRRIKRRRSRCNRGDDFYSRSVFASSKSLRRAAKGPMNSSAKGGSSSPSSMTNRSPTARYSWTRLAERVISKSGDKAAYRRHRVRRSRCTVDELS